MELFRNLSLFCKIWEHQKVNKKLWKQVSVAAITELNFVGSQDLVLKGKEAGERGLRSKTKEGIQHSGCWKQGIMT